MDACARACVCVYAFMCTCNARSQMKNSKKKFVSARENSKIRNSSKEYLARERESLGKRSRLDFNTRQSLILFYYKFVLLQTASASASANK